MMSFRTCCAIVVVACAARGANAQLTVPPLQLHEAMRVDGAAHDLYQGFPQIME